MAIKVLFSENQREIAVGGLYQWDFGQVLEIECAELGSEIMEVHFACNGMREAIVRVCQFNSGIGTVTIPDQCLEQANTITAWIYSISDTQGHTVKTITLSITARTRPSASREVPAEYIDKYAEALTAVNEAINNLENGTVTAAQATHAVSADSASTATNAASASYATSAHQATSATYANTSGRLSVSKDYPAYIIEVTDGSGHTDINFSEGLYAIAYESDNTIISGVGYIGKNSGSANCYSISLGKITLWYEEYASETTSSGSGAGVSLIYLDESSPIISNTGILAFFKIGGFANG